MKVFVLVLAAISVTGGASLFAHDIGEVEGPLTFSVGVPIVYINNIDPLATFEAFSGSGVLTNLAAATDNDLVFRLLGDLRAGLEFDFLLNVVPNFLAVGINTAAQGSYGFHPNTPKAPAVILDVPVRAAFRVGLEDIGYLQIHSGLYLQNLIYAVEAGGTFPIFRYIDVGMRLRIGTFSFMAGYLIDVAPAPTGDNLLADPKFPFYAGVYLSLI